MQTSWKEESGTLTKTFRFQSFNKALLFVTRVGTIAEAQHHHPDISIENYNTVVIKTTTHDSENTVTQKDYALTEAIDKNMRRTGLAKYLTKFRVLEFIIAGLIVDLIENIVTLKLTTGEAITWNIVGIALIVIIPFAILTELVIDHPLFWKKLFTSKK